MSKRRAPLAACVVLCAGLGVGPAFAQSVKQIGIFHDWSAYSASEGADAICFAMAKPSEVAPSPDDYTQAYLYLTRRPSQNVSDELNLVAGFMFQPDSTATLSVVGQNYQLFTQNDAAWLQDPTQNDNLAGMMRAGTSVVIEGISDKGIKVKETFSLSGATAATKAVSTGC